ncbi:IclR family transcriptional regulator [Variovorax sp. J31P179]|uniref:IclR family transcriptional regulator n=1 Tax=Variovorax sp. J31P179 TaxID=3053508 RepID=UPI0025791903|nr:IclR family transcriptional regulator [Variovorax sp. J31P179]MDM0085419.1 IclR family transcriptional regulator [Variovorax sp. J31P179]
MTGGSKPGELPTPLPRAEAGGGRRAGKEAREGSLRRGASVLRLLATAGRRGMALTDLARATGLPNSSMHRLLAQLQAERLAMRIEDTRHYVIGPLAYELGLAAAQQFDVRAQLRPTLERLAQDAEETSYLILRSGEEAVCLDLAEGPTPLRVVTLQVGSRRPLGWGAGGLAILSALPEDERRFILGRVTSRIERQWGFPAALVEASVAEAARTGVAVIRNRVNPGVTALGMPFLDSLGQVVGAVTLAAANARMGPERLSRLTELLTRGRQDIRKTLGAGQWLRLGD